MGDGLAEGAPNDTKSKGHTTGDLARLTSNSLRAVRHYEELGLIQARDRSGRSHRLFDETQLKRLRLITDMRALAFPLPAIQSLLAARDGKSRPGEAADQAVAVLDAHINSLHDKLRTLRRVRDQLVTTRATIEECRTCDETWDSCACDDCDVRRDRDLPDLVRLLW
jgi:DNA-binding transcriptional MerR regulator